MQTLTLVVAHSNGPRCKHTDKCLHGNVMCAKRHPLLEVQSDLDHPAISDLSGYGSYKCLNTASSVGFIHVYNVLYTCTHCYTVFVTNHSYGHSTRNNFPGITSQFAIICIFAWLLVTCIQNICCVAVFFHRSVQNFILKYLSIGWNC